MCTIFACTYLLWIIDENKNKYGITKAQEDYSTVDSTLSLRGRTLKKLGIAEDKIVDLFENRE